MKSESLVLGGYPHHLTSWTPEAPTARPVVALHGFGVTGYRTYRYVAPQLNRHGMPIYAPDLLGFGRSAAPDTGYALSHYAELTAALVTTLGIDRPVLMGHSLGGKIAAATVAAYADLFAGLILVNSGGFSRYAPWLARFGGARWVSALFRKPWFVRHIVPRTPLKGIISDPAHVAQILRFQPAHRALDLNHTGLMPRLADVPLPVLILWGEDDRILPRSTVQRIKKAFPQATVHIIPGAGHGPMKDQPDLFAEAVRAFVVHCA